MLLFPRPVARRTLRQLCLLVSALVCSGLALAQTLLPAAVQRVVEGHGLPASSYGFHVQEVGAAEPALSINGETSLIPASTIKTVTTLAALDTLGPAYTWRTELYALGPVVDGTLQGDLLMRGTGDPFLVEEQLRGMLKVLRRSGVQRISGNLVLDGSYFDASVVEQENIDNQAGRAYNTEPHAVIANFQTVTFFFYPHGNGRDVLILSDPYLPNLRIDNRLRQKDASCSGYQRGISFGVNPDDVGEVVFSGDFPSRCTVFQMTREVLDPLAYTFGLFNTLWQELGGVLDGALVEGSLPEGMQPLVVWTSPPLSDVITSINKYSNNLMTRHLLLTLGAEQSAPPATVEKGVAAVNAWLSAQSIDASRMHMVNGSGLSRAARVTPAFMNEVLQAGYRSLWMPEFVSSLPLNGLDGTMRSRVRGAAQRGRMHVKTGSLDGVSGVAGYVTAHSGKVYAVTGILNHELADRGPGVELMDALLAWVLQL
jgi:D-alanyl-D-alanine carboxypeptidase/D-alanyl-D-alanine-endopeptidase (penicillin-binding protein 4)